MSATNISIPQSIIENPGTRCRSSKCPVRAYFYRDGRELADHPLHGATIMSAGAFVVRDGEMVKDERTELSVVYWNDQLKGFYSRKVTVEDFGGVAVTVKDWCPNPAERRTWRLVGA